MNKKNNKQFQNSDVRMKKAMLELMNTTPFDKITVRLICERAEVNRSTFYAHYKDIYDMIEQMERNLQKNLMDNYPVPEKVTPLSLESFIIFLEFIRKYKDFYRVALKARREFPLKQGIGPLWVQIIRPLCFQAGITSESEMMFYFVGFQAGFTMILKRWVEQDCIESEKTIAQIIQNIIPSIWKEQ
ncbi:MAG: TetR/AcrR family transcriptional regulator [Lachnospiraceae bacterium]|nr:TetR/AcrR family transcriptional regulator [Lachnospiraceae bacterium]